MHMKSRTNLQRISENIKFSIKYRRKFNIFSKISYIYMKNICKHTNETNKKQIIVPVDNGICSYFF